MLRQYQSAILAPNRNAVKGGLCLQIHAQSNKHGFVDITNPLAYKAIICSSIPVMRVWCFLISCGSKEPSRSIDFNLAFIIKQGFLQALWLSLGVVFRS